MEADDPPPPAPSPSTEEEEQVKMQKAEVLSALASGPLSSSAAKLSCRSAAIPSGRDFHFYNNFDPFRAPTREIADASGSLLSSIGSSSGALFGRKQPPQPTAASTTLPEDLDEAYDWLVNLNDEAFERFGASMDEFRGLREKEEEEEKNGARIRLMGLDSGFQMVCGKNKKKKKKNGVGGGRDLAGDEGVEEAGGTLAVVKVASRDNRTTAPRSRVPFHIPTIPRPQDEFNIRANNANEPFEHVWLERSEDGSRFIHPLEKLSVSDFVNRNIGEDEPVKPLPVENSPFKLVEGVKELKELASKLHNVNEFAVDLEHNHYRTFQGLTCLMQISTRTEDFVIDTLKLRIHVGPHLREVFKDPSKSKVMHGADHDILWLQRDFGIYVCNLFDTQQASRILQLERNSLEFLLRHFCGVTANKEYQNADWRLRPLPDVMLKYAREDTHYLLYIYDVMRHKLLSESSESGNGDLLLAEVYKRSYDICMHLYEKDLLTDTSYLYIYGLYDTELNAQQLAIVAGLCGWRDKVAREEDESTGYILPNKALLEIARQMPLSSGKLRHLVRSKHPFVERNLSSVIDIIRSSLGNAAAFESVSQQLKKGPGEAASEPDASVPLPAIGDPKRRGTTVSEMEIVDVDDGSSVQMTEHITVSLSAKDDGLNPALTGCDGDQGALIGHYLSASSTEVVPSDLLSAGVKITNKGMVENGTDLPSQSAKTVNVASVQMLKKPIGAFGALLGKSSTKSKPNPDPKRRFTERDMSGLKLEQIKSSVALPFHSFSGGVEDSKDGPEETVVAPLKSGQPESLEHHQYNEPAEATELEEVILLENESDDSELPLEIPIDSDSKHEDCFPQLPENGRGEEGSVVSEPMSLSDISARFEKCFQSRNQTRTPKENLRSSQVLGSGFRLQPFDYATARKEVNFGNDRQGEVGAEGDDCLRKLSDSKVGGGRAGSLLSQVEGEERARDFQQPRRCQAFPASGNRSATFR